MTVDPEQPIAVFLGPSLPHDTAAELLDARYLPPAQFGDVYRLIGSGVHTLVLIDGVFHGRASVWHRELLCAMRNGIRVFGAGSMGALRAAELHGHGMIGLGTIFQWYLTGELDGDDEVALMHADAEHRYRPMSQPLVNVRFNLREAVARGVLEQGEAASLVVALKAMPFWERTLNALWNAPAYRALEASRQGALRAFFDKDAVDLKRRDAAQALAEVARRRNEAPPVVPSSSIEVPSASASPHDRFRLLKRNFSGDPDHPVEGQALAGHLLAEPTRRKSLRWAFGARFFVRQWALGEGRGVPSAEVPALTAAFHHRVGAHPLAAWLRANRLTAAEHEELLSRRLLWDWLLGQPPEHSGLSSRLRDERLLPEFPEVEPLEAVCSREEVARALPYVAAWCRQAGAAPEARELAALSARWHAALESLVQGGGQAWREPFLQAVWALEKGPVYFGHSTWSLEVELLFELQLTGRVSGLAARWETKGA